jgi:hypothetical protein
MSSKDELLALGHVPMPVLKAITAKCLWCSGGSRAEVKDCLVKDCPLYPYRMGKNPWRRAVSEGTRQVRRQNATKVNQRANIAE